MKKFFAVLMLAAALILPGLAQAKDAQTSMIDDVVKRGVLRVGFSSFADGNPSGEVCAPA